MTDIRAIVSHARFTPTEAQCRYKAEFWKKQVGDVSPDFSIEQVVALGASGRISRWKDVPGFLEWFLNKESNKQRSEELLIRAMDRLGEILRDAEDHKILLDAAKEARTLHTQLHAPDKTVEKYADDTIQEMTREQLAAYINKFRLTNSNK